MTVEEMNQRMSNAEFVCWSMYHARKAQRQELAEKVSKNRKR